MLFNFMLTPLADIEPWGPPGQRRLHWFGLTHGQYWIEAGGARLLEYSDTVQRRHGISRYCDYQVARLYEDVMALAPHVLDAVPADLVPVLADTGWQRSPVSDMRWLDTAYLSPGADIVLWSDTSTVHIEWNNRDKRIEEAAAWSALQGCHRMTRADFVAECRSFHARLMAAMSERVDRVAAGALLPEIQVDLQALAREHEKRQCLAESTFGPLPSPTDWQAVRTALEAIDP